jgi:RHS repeat-associated protein
LLCLHRRRRVELHRREREVITNICGFECTVPGYGSANNGNLMTQTIGDGAGWSVAQTYGYDKLNRVLSAEEPGITGGQGWKRSYNYDRWGNQWVDATNSSGINVYSVTPTGSAWITPKNRINLSAGSYDRAGNQTSLPPYSAAYDADNRLTTMSGTLAYAYDGEGRRVTKVNGSLTTRFVYDAFGKLAAEYAVGTAPSGAPQPECSTCYLTVDHLGSTRVLWDSAGVKGRYDYMPFGDAIPSDRNKRDSVACAAGVTACYAVSGSLTMRFTGKERDAETSNSAMGDGLDYFGARYYSGAQGRFTSPDPGNAGAIAFDPQSWNMYAYGLNNPHRYVDPDGEAALLATAAGGAGVGFLIGAGKEAWSAYQSGAGFGDMKTWQKIGAKGAGGAVFGFGVGLTGGMSLWATAGVSGVASVAGGALERAADGDDSTEATDLVDAGSDLAGGLVGGGVGYGAQALLRARINAPEYFQILQRQIRRAKRVAGNATRPARQAARLEQANTGQAQFDSLNTWWQRLTVQWPAAAARSAAKAGTKAAVSSTIRYLSEEEARKLREQH